MLKFTLALATFVVIEAWYDGEFTYQQKIAAEIINRANTAVSPRNSDRPLQLIVDVMLTDYDFDDGELDVYTWEGMEWDDFHIGWNPEDYGGIDRVEIPYTLIYTPLRDWYLINGQEEDDRMEHTPNAIVHHTGHIILVHPKKHTVFCEKDDELSSFLTSVYHCSLTYGSWAMDTTQLQAAFREGFEQLNVDVLREYDNDIMSNRAGRLAEVKHDPSGKLTFASAVFSFDITHTEDSIF